MSSFSANYPPTTATVEHLPNGLAVILDPDPGAEVVSTQLWVETGSIHEDAHLGAGISHFLEHMVFKGTRSFQADELAHAVQAAGGHWNAYTSFERTVYYIDGPAHEWQTFLKIVTELVFFPTLPEAEFEKEKDVIRREIDMGLDDPDNVGSRLLFSTAFTHDARRLPVIGHRHLFDALKYDDLRNYHADRYTPERAFVVISGGFDPDTAKKLLEELTADVALGGGREPFVPADSPQIGQRRGHATFAVPTSRVTLAWKTPTLAHPDAAAYEVLSAVLGRGRSSRCVRHLREERELALEISAWAWLDAHRDGLIAVSAEALPEKRDALIAAIAEEVANVGQGITEDELAKAQRQIFTNQFRSLVTASGRASDLGSNWHEARDLDFTRRFVEAVSAVGIEDVARVAATLTEATRTLTILDPEETQAKPAALQQRGGKGDTIETLTLANGAQIAFIPDHRVPLVHVQAALRAGLPSETAATQGINQLLAATLTQGTRTRGSQELALALESLGAGLGASAGNNSLAIQAAGLAVDLPVLIDTLAEVLTEPVFPDDAILREAASQRSALEESLEDPLSTGFRQLRQAIFGEQGYGLDLLGSTASQAAWTRDALLARHARHFTGRNLALAVCGDFEPARAADLLAAAFEKLPAGERWHPPVSSAAGGVARKVSLPKKQQAVIAIGFPGASINSADRHAFAMIQEYASDMAGPLFTRIREDLGLAYRVGASQFLGFDTGMFSFFVATSPDQVELAERELLAEIAKIASHGIPAADFERVRATVLSGLALHQQGLASVARTVALDLLFDHGADDHRKLPALYRALQADEVAAAAQRLLSQAPAIVTVMPE